MSAATYRMNIEQGATYSLDCVLSETDLTGYLGRGQVRLTTAAAASVGDFTVTITDAATGAFTVTLPASELADLDLTGTTNHASYIDAAYDIELYTGSTVLRVLNGVARISPNATR